jgi:hypothetical protein
VDLDGRLRRTLTVTLTAAVNLFWTLAAASAVIAPVLGLIWVGMMRRDSPAQAPALENPPASGIVVWTEVTAIWIPQALRDLARRQAGTPVDCSPEDVQMYLARNGWRDGWYATTRWDYGANGQSAEITQIRWLSEAADHLDELQAVMATAAGRPPRYEGPDFSHPRVKIIPDTLRAVDSHEAITRLVAELVGGVKTPPTGSMGATRTTE